MTTWDAIHLIRINEVQIKQFLSGTGGQNNVCIFKVLSTVILGMEGKDMSRWGAHVRRYKEEKHRRKQMTKKGNLFGLDGCCFMWAGDLLLVILLFILLAAVRLLPDFPHIKRVPYEA